MSFAKNHLVLCRPGFSETLTAEFNDRWDLHGLPIHKAAVSFTEQVKLPPIRETIFARQYLPLAMQFSSPDIKATAEFVLKRLEVVAGRGNRQNGKWTMHCFAIDDDPSLHHAMKVEKALLPMLRIRLADFFKRYVSPEDFEDLDHDDNNIVVQLFAASPSEVWLSVANLGSGVLPHVGGIQRMKRIHGAPSRSSSKLNEALVFIEKTPSANQTAVDLGAAPGGWTYVLAMHGANVTAIDHAELDLPNSKKLAGTITHLKTNGLKYMTDHTIDWLCCDMVMGAQQTIEVLDQWLAAKKMKNFIVNVKLPQDQPWPSAQAALKLLDKYRSQGWTKLAARHLYHDRNEITLMGCT